MCYLGVLSPNVGPRCLCHKQYLLFQNPAVLYLKAEQESCQIEMKSLLAKKGGDLKMFTFSYLMVLDHILLA